jgi:hypothetical protein
LKNIAFVCILLNSSDISFAFLDGFGGLVVSIPEFAGSNPAEAVGFFGHPENPQYAFLRMVGKIICPMSQLSGM